MRVAEPGAGGIRRFLAAPLGVFRSLFFDPVEVLRKWRGIPYFLANGFRWIRANREQRFRVRVRDLHYATSDRFRPAGNASGHYFFQDLWAAQRLHEWGVTSHVDIASRVDGFVAHALSFARVIYVDVRPLASSVDGLEYRTGNLVDLPFPDSSIASLSCLHVLEHVGLGRYGDPVDPDGYRRAARELQRVLASGGRLLLGVPIGRQRLCFDAHRVFSHASVLELFPELVVEEFSLVPDSQDRLIRFADPEQAEACQYGCGLFVFRRDSH